MRKSGKKTQVGNCLAMTKGKKAERDNKKYNKEIKKRKSIVILNFKPCSIPDRSTI